jgi:hypothetical protein
MTSLSENPALSNPRKALTKSQQDALASIDFFRFQKPTRGGWAIGNKRFPTATINKLAEQGFVTRAPRSLHLTQAGKLALDKLKGQSQ